MSKDENKTATDAVVDSAPAVDAVAAKLKEFGASDETVAKVKELGVEAPEDFAELTETDLTTAGLPVVKARKLLDAVKPAKIVETPVVSNAALEAVLPSVQDDESWLKELKIGGLSKVSPPSVTAAVRAALADSSGLFDVLAKVVSEMEKFADENDEQVDVSFFALRKQLTRRSYAELFEAIDGLDASFVTKERKARLLSRLKTYLLPSLSDFNTQLNAWRDSWFQGAVDPGALMMVFAGGGGALPPGVVQAPDTSGVRDAADAVNDAINKTFAGTGVQIAAALAYEAQEIKKALQDPRLPAMVGAANREQMLKKLGAAVPATYPRLETNLTRYVLGVMNLDDQASGDEERSYLSALWMLGNQIDWSQLNGGGGPLSRLGGRSTATRRDLGKQALNASSVQSFGYDPDGDAYRGTTR